MKADFTPSKPRGVVTAPPSKSVAHRALICASLAGGAKVNNIALSDDISATLGCLNALGAQFEVNGSSVCIGGVDPYGIPENVLLNCNESGSTLRFLIPLCLLGGKKVTFTGSKRLMERPLTVYESICIDKGFDFIADSDVITVKGSLKSGMFSVPGDISSQFISGLLFALPLLDGESVIDINGKLESAPYIDITLAVLADFGINIYKQDGSFIIPGGQKYKTAGDYTVEGDHSNAAYLACFNVLDGEVNVNGLDEGSSQGDKVFKSMFNGLANGKKRFDLSNCPDLAPIMFALAAYTGGAEFSGTARLRLKESDRASVMAAELKKFGVEAIIGDDGVIINSNGIKPPETILSGHNDHRIVMALSALCTVTGGIVDGIEAVNKSFPDYFEKIKALGAEFNITG